MSRQKTAETRIEIELRRRLHAAGLRYRLHRRIIPKTRREVDIVHAPTRVAVFVDGCFWHRCPEHGTEPVANSEWWSAKLQANWARDRDSDARLSVAGWLVIRIWEHDDLDTATALITTAVSQRRAGTRLAK